MELVPTLLSGSRGTDNVIWIKRSFSDMYSEDGNTVHPLAGNFVDLMGDRQNEAIAKRLQGLAQRLAERVDATNQIHLTVPWCNDTEDSGGGGGGAGGLNGSTAEQKQYFKQLADKYYAVLKEVVDRILTKKSEEAKVHDRMVYKCDQFLPF